MRNLNLKTNIAALQLRLIFQEKNSRNNEKFSCINIQEDEFFGS